MVRKRFVKSGECIVVSGESLFQLFAGFNGLDRSGQHFLNFFAIVY